MVAEVEAEQLLLQAELVLGVHGHVGAPGVLDELDLAGVEKGCLARLGLASLALGGLPGLVQVPKQLAALADAVAGAGLDQSLHHPVVDLLQAGDALEQLSALARIEGSVGFALCDD